MKPCLGARCVGSVQLATWDRAFQRLLPGVLLLTCGCSVGQGEGYVRSERLLVEDCWEGGFDLKPDFFGANPFEDSLSLRIQRGQENVLESDGVALLVRDVETIRQSRLGEMLPLGLPVGVAPLGFPLPAEPSPPVASLTLYLNSSCRNQNASLSAVSGFIQFDRLFSGDINDADAEDRLTEGRFEAQMVDPQTAVPRANVELGEPSYTYPEEAQSLVEGWFRFVFHRGAPAQPFP